MTYRLNSHLKRIDRSLPLWGYLLLCQIPEGISTLLQKQWEISDQGASRFLFFFIYPVFCIFSAVSTGLTYLIIKHPPATSGYRKVFTSLRSSFLCLSGASIFLGFLILPALMAFIIPGVFVMAFYLFIPFFILEDPKKPFWSFFSQSKLLFKNQKMICLLTSSTMISMSLISFLGFLQTPLFFEIILSIFLSLAFNIWLSTLFLEVNPS